MSDSRAAAEEPAPRRRRGEHTAERILDAAEELFAQRGYVGTTLRDVAGLVGIRIPSLYNYFDSKEALYGAVLQRGLGPAFEVLSKYAVQASEEAAGYGPRRLAETLMDVLVERPRLARLIQHETLTGGEHLSPILRGWMASIFDRSVEVIEGQGAAGRWDRDEISLLVLAFFNVITGYFCAAALFEEMQGRDLLSEEMLAKQLRVFGDLIETTFESR